MHQEQTTLLLKRPISVTKLCNSGWHTKADRFHLAIFLFIYYDDLWHFGNSASLRRDRHGSSTFPSQLDKEPAKAFGQPCRHQAASKY